MIFGNTKEFAIEALVEPGSEFAPVQSGQVAGRIRAWLNGVPVGRFDEPACWLGPPCSHLARLMADVGHLWDDSFHGLTPDAIFDRLDREYFGANRHRLLDDLDGDTPLLPELRNAERYTFLIHSSEAFDGWKGFLVSPTETTLMGLILPDDSDELAVSHFQRNTYCQSVRDFSQWLRVQEELLVKRE